MRKNGASTMPPEGVVVMGEVEPEDIVDLADSQSVMVPSGITVKGERLLAWKWDARRPLSVEAKVNAHMGALGPATERPVLDRFNRPVLDPETGQPLTALGWDRGAYFEAVARMLCELVPNLTLEQADLINEDERIRILRHLGYLRDEPAPAAAEGKATSPSPASTGEPRPADSPASIA